MNTNNTLVFVEQPDEALVVLSLKGDRNAFGQIVARYQSLVCALAYNGTGNLAQSEDLAQETFVTAWQKLASLREPSRLRAWLCSIVRNLSLNRRRHDSREPSHLGQPQEVLNGIAAGEPSPDAQAVRSDEEAIMWRALEKIPDLYREPMILFYREQQSIGAVAETLELNEEVVRQRLSRGRKLLDEQVTAFVESTLARTNPGKGFTTGVLSALPMMASSVKTASAAATMAKGATAFKFATLAGWSGAILGPIAGVLGGWFGLKASIESSHSPEERSFKIKMARSGLILLLVTLIGQALLVYAMNTQWKTHPVLVCAMTVGFWVGYVIVLSSLIAFSNSRMHAFKSKDGTLASDGSTRRAFEYRSRWTFAGFPLLHINTGMPLDGWGRTAFGWIAVGDKAVGLVAIGGLSLGVFSMGGIAFGLVCAGGIAAGPVAMAGVAVGGWAFGGVALGYDAFGGTALALRAAYGGVAVARDFATGGSVHAAHANDEMAKAFMAQSPFFSSSKFILIIAPMLIWVPMVLVVLQAICVSRAKRTSARLRIGELLGQSPKPMDTPR